MKLTIAGLAVVCGGMGMLLSFGQDVMGTKGGGAPAEEFFSEVIAIKHERAADIAAALNNLTTEHHGLGTNLLASKRGAENALSNASVNISSQFKVVADEKTNSLLFYA